MQRLIEEALLPRTDDNNKLYNKIYKVLENMLIHHFEVMYIFIYKVNEILPEIEMA